MTDSESGAVSVAARPRPSPTHPHLVQEGCPSKDHANLTGVVGVVQPAAVPRVPGVEASWEPNQSVTVLPPHSAGWTGGGRYGGVCLV